jgi:tetratricopeptide (TPR) repeat protein
MNRQQRRKAAKATRRGGVGAAPVVLQQRFQEAVARYQGGRLADAEALLQTIEADQPGISDVCHLRGVIALQSGAPDRAILHLQAAIAASPRLAGLHALLGTACAECGEIEAAIDAFKRALRLDPKSVDAHYNFANVLRDAGQLTEAEPHYRNAIRLEPDFADAHYNLGLALIAAERFEDAVESLNRALALSPGHADVHISLSNAHSMLRRYVDGELHARAALDIEPDEMTAHNNLARALQGLGRTDEAADSMRRALSLDPENPTLHANFGNILEDLGLIADAEASYRQAATLSPDFAGAHTNLGLLLLLTGKYDEGWREYDWRWRRPHWERRPFPQPSWNGENLSGKTVLAWGDEGPGDEILFASLLPKLIEAAGTCIVECAPRLAGLFERAFPGAEIHPRRARPSNRLLRDDIDHQTPFTELARWLRPNLAAAPKPERAYLTADADLAAACRERYRALGDGPVVGIAWASGNLRRPDRNAPLPLWDPILQLSGLTFLSLQYGDHADAIAEANGRLGVTIHEDPHIDQLKSLEQFAAQIEAVDIVVSITNTTVHMAGAIGKTVWTMLPFMPDWRYQLGRDDTAWYPSMRLFRQQRARHWDEVIARVARDLAAFRDTM